MGDHDLQVRADGGGSGGVFGFVREGVTIGVIITQLILSAAAVGISFLAAQLLKNKGPRAPFDSTATTLTSRGSQVRRIWGRQRVGYVFAWAGKRTGHGRKGTVLYYEEGWHLICVGPVYKLWAIYQNNKNILKTPIDRDTHPSGSEITLSEDRGTFRIYWGDCDQPVNTYLGNPATSRDGISKFPGATSRWPNVCYVQWKPKKLQLGSPTWSPLTYEVEYRIESNTTTLADSDPYIPPTSPATGTTVWFNGGSAVPAGTYTVSYVEGAHIDEVGQGWRVQQKPGNGWFIVNAAGTKLVRCPGNFNQYPSQADAETGNAAAGTGTVVHPGGTLGLNLVDDKYNNNTDGTPNPTYNIDDGAGHSYDAIGVVRPNIGGTGDDGANPAHVLWEILTGRYPHGLGIDPDWLDLDAFETLGSQCQDERLAVNLFQDDGEDVKGVLGRLMADCGIVMPQVNGRLSPRLVRAALAISVPTVTADMNADALPSTEQVHGNVLPTATSFYIRDRQRGYKANDIQLPDTLASAVEHGRRLTRQVEITTITSTITAKPVAQRKQQEQGTEPTKIKFRAAREAAMLVSGDPFFYNGSQYRLASITPGLGTAVPVLSAVLDQYGRDAVDFGDDGRDDADGDLTAAPDPLVAAVYLPSALRPVAANEYFGVMRVRDDVDIAGANVYLSTDAGDTGVDVGNAVECPGGTLNSPLSNSFYGTTTVATGPSITPVGPDITNVQDLTGRDDEYNAGQQLAYIEGEWFLLRKLTPVSGGYRLDGLTRAQYGSSAVDHAANTPVFIISDRAQLNAIQSAILASGSMRYVRTQPFTDIDLVDVSFVDPVSFSVP
jgi:hypothetical protein